MLPMLWWMAAHPRTQLESKDYPIFKKRGRWEIREELRGGVRSE